jgi:hypothetical protein
VTRSNSYFKAGSGVYVCGICKKRTRETGDGESGCDLCAKCWDREGRRNTHLDHHDTPVDGCEFCEEEEV